MDICAVTPYMMTGRAGGEQQTDASRRGDQPSGKVLAVLTAFRQHRGQKTAEGEDGNAGSAGKSGEIGAGHHRHRPQAAGQPSKGGTEETHKALSRGAFGKHITGDGEEGDGRNHVSDKEVVCLVGQGLQSAPVA